MDIKPGLYKHFKGGHAIVLGVAAHSEAHHMKLVIYRHLDAIGDDAKVDTEQIWARPADMFTQTIIRGQFEGPRFWRVGTLKDALKKLGGELVVGGDEPVEDVSVKEASLEPAPSKDRAIHDASMPGGILYRQ